MTQLLVGSLARLSSPGLHRRCIRDGGAVVRFEPDTKKPGEAGRERVPENARKVEFTPTRGPG